MNLKQNNWLTNGSPWLWLYASTVSISIIMVVGLIGMIAYEGIRYFWPTAVQQFTLVGDDQQQHVILGEVVEDEQGYDPAQDANRRRMLIKIGNRRLHGIDFKWIWHDQVITTQAPQNVVVIERQEYGNFIGFMQEKNYACNNEYSSIRITALHTDIADAQQMVVQRHALEQRGISKTNQLIEALRLERKKIDLSGKELPTQTATLDNKQRQLDAVYEQQLATLGNLNQQINELCAIQVESIHGEKLSIPLGKVVRLYQPNTFGFIDKIGFFLIKIKDFLTMDPREANTEGGVFPAIFGTVAMIFIMTIFVTPMGVVAAIYLREYAKQNIFTRLIRISVNNLAGVPSVVYGVFGLGFFVYFLGGTIDTLFFPESLPAPTFGSPGILWSSLTLALLTLPVVIVSTEEGLTRVPSHLREGSLALGATKFETLWKVVLPMSSPAMMTGLILAIARAAGEVAPLMLVGVVKLAPDLVIDATAPFIHLDRKFMHLGFHIYDVGFQSPNVDATRPLVYATALLLVLVVVALNLTAVWLRNRLREKYKMLDN